MELPSLINKVLEKAAPISALENKRINDDCRLWYETMVKKVQTKVDALKEEPSAPALTIVDKGILQLDSWYVRLGLTLSYFFIVRFIQDMMNPGDDDGDDDEHNK